MIEEDIKDRAIQIMDNLKESLQAVLTNETEYKSILKIYK